MKITRLVILNILLLSILNSYAQDGSPSPYSFFGLGDVSFKGTTENLSMGGINSYVDSLHYNINTPAALSYLKLVNLNIGISNNFLNISDQTQQQWFSAHNVSYFSLAFPVGKKAGIGFGLLPVNSSGYMIYKETDIGTDSYKGDGGNSRAFLAAAYNLTKSFSLGAEYQYYFGYLNRENYWIPAASLNYTKENDFVDFSGATLKLSALYKHSLPKQHYFNLFANYRFATQLDATYRSGTRVITPLPGGEETVEYITNADESGSIDFPEQFDGGIGYGQANKWFVGVQYTYKDLQSFRNPFYDPDYVTYNKANEFKFGGMFIPQYNSITKYWKRVTYRAGAYYKNTGMNIYDEDITDFGITFGVGLPAVRGVSNLNIGFELGQRGKITDHLVQENYINLNIGISLNDRWFLKRKIN